MKKFSFEFQDILEYREFEEDNAKSELAKALAVENEIQNNLDNIAQQYAKTKHKMQGSRNYDDVISAGQYYHLLEYKKEEFLKQLAEAKIVSDEKRKILAEAMKKTEALNKLKESQIEEYKAAVNLEEENEADDINTIRAARAVLANNARGYEER